MSTYLEVRCRANYLLILCSFLIPCQTCFPKNLEEQIQMQNSQIPLSSVPECVSGRSAPRPRIAVPSGHLLTQKSTVQQTARGQPGPFVQVIPGSQIPGLWPKKEGGGWVLSGLVSLTLQSLHSIRKRKVPMGPWVTLYVFNFFGLYNKSVRQAPLDR